MRNVIAVLTLVLASFSAKAQVLELVPSTSTVEVGDEVVITIRGSGFTELLGGGIDLGYAGLWLGTVALADPPWDDGFAPTETIDNATGWLTNFSFNQFSGVSGSFEIAQLTFTALKAGAVEFDFKGSSLFPFADMGGAIDPADLDFQVPADPVVVVPEPGTWALLVAGLGLLFVLGRGRRQAGIAAS